ncbi:MAG: DUF1937 family protein [Acetobacteraceae bacterium]|nr:DUF1937 family protein [Acetobacteraceae bacterium]
MQLAEVEGARVHNVDHLWRPAGGILYLAGPYTHPDSEVRKRRYIAITDVAAQLVARGHIVFSPLTMTHPIDRVLAREHETLGSDYWVKFDESFMEVCADIVVFMLDGWQFSAGVQREVLYFSERKRPVYFLDPQL